MYRDIMSGVSEFFKNAFDDMKESAKARIAGAQERIRAAQSPKECHTMQTETKF